MKLDSKTIIGIIVLVVLAWIAYRLVKALLPVIFVAAVAFFAWRWYRNRRR